MMQRLALAFLTATIAACGASDGDSSSQADAAPTSTPDAAPPQGDQAPFARFTITHDGVATPYDIRVAGRNKIICDEQYRNYVYIDFGDWEAGGPALDLDVSGDLGSGHFEHDEPRGGPRVAFVWHDAPTGGFSTTESAGPCSLDLNVNGTILTGEFRCAQLVGANGDSDFSVSDGQFRCELTRAE